MAIDRFERILYKLAQRHAPHLTPAGWNQAGDKLERVQKLARDLARYSVLVMVGNVAQPKAIDVQVTQWVNLHAQFYGLLARTLFPTFSNIQAQYADSLTPPVVVMMGDASPVLNGMAGIVLPYLAMRQPKATDVSDGELLGLMDILLKDLEAGDLPSAVYTDIQHQCAVLLRQLLKGSVTHVMLTLFDKPVLEMITPEKPKDIPLKPTLLPKTGRLNPLYGEPPTSTGDTKPAPDLTHLPDDNVPNTPTEQMFVKDIFLDKSRKRVLPLPDLPKPDKKKKDDK
ncbi:MAG TPA: hypothetical protein PLZ51_06435 [Aggregatilineales bacterium]|nr:hypothetical protein [Aggregatilineales bacterium]